MPIMNIIDKRAKPYRFKTVNAIIEPTRHDNSVKNSDRAPQNTKQDKAWLGYDEKNRITLADAVTWASKHKDDVTLYIYDRGRGTNIVASGKVKR